jgi:TPR repeat protein
LLKAADLGDTDAQYWLGYAFDAGICVEENSEKSLHYLQMAAKAKHPGACYYLAQMYRSGEKVEKNPVVCISTFCRC